MGENIVWKLKLIFHFFILISNSSDCQTRKDLTDAVISISGDFASAIETLVTAISLIKQSKIANDDRCKILISSLQDTLHGIEEKSYGSKWVESIFCCDSIMFCMMHGCLTTDIFMCITAHRTFTEIPSWVLDCMVLL